MQYKDNKVSDIQIAYIGGGSRGWAWTFMTDLALDQQISGTIRLYDIDKAAAQKNEIIGNRLMQQAGANGNWKFETKDTLESVLHGCDFVVISILPGTFDEMESDVHLPERLGIFQSVGDTAGPGGMIRALRTIPMFVEIANAIKEYSPDAWVINYTNPMSLCVKALYETFPEIKAFGCCHEVFGTQKVLKGIYEKETGEKIADWHDVEVNVVGINHFTWFTEASYKGVNLFPVYRNYIEKHFQDGYTLKEENWLNANFRCKHRVKMDLFKRYGWIAAAGDRHLVEFMPGNEYLKDPETVQSWDYSLTTVQWRKEDLKERLERSNRLAEGKETIRLEPTGEEGILLIKALCGLQRFISNVNIPNYASQIPNLPKDAIVETNAVFSKDHIRPVYAGPLKDDVLQLIKPHIENHALTYRAAIQCDKALVMQAFQNDPNVKGHHPSSEEIHELVEDMIQNTLTYLPEGWKNY
jgi:alpha-galactosidase